MWIFTSNGLLMPSAVPEDKASTRWTWGIFTLQVRARVREHLESFMEQYMEPGTYNPEIQETPDMDYNFRFYTTNGAFADAMAKAVMDIDYTKFKPTAEHDHEYHKVLNDIWSTVISLNKPGGKWGRIIDSYSYRSADGYNVYGLHDDEIDDDGRPIGSSFLPDEDDLSFVDREFRDKLIEDLDNQGIDPEGWVDYVTDYEWELLMPEYSRRMADKRWEEIKADFEQKYDTRKVSKLNKSASRGTNIRSGKKKSRARRGVHFE